MYYPNVKQQDEFLKSSDQKFDRYKASCYNLTIKINKKGIERRWKEINSQILKFSNSQILKFSNSQILKFSNSQILKFNLLLGKFFNTQQDYSTKKKFLMAKFYFNKEVAYGF